MQVGSLVIELAANVARLRSDMDKARSVVESSTAKMAKAAEMAKKALGAIGVALAASAFASFIKGAIGALDAMSKLSQRAGIAVKDVAGLQLAFRQSGLEAGALQSSMARLNKGIADGNKAFDAMGVSTKNADGSLKSARDVLGEVADKFASYENGAAKAAIAQEIFGRTGADMIPLLNGGAKALDDFDAMAAKLGLTMSQETAQAAEKFNDTIDLMGQGVQGIGRQIAAQLLPTFQVLADKMFGAFTEGDRMKMMVEALSFALKVLASGLILVVEFVAGMARGFIASFAAIKQALEGDFAGAWKTYTQGFKDTWKSVGESLTTIGELWTETGNASVASVAATTRAMKDQAPVIKEVTKLKSDAAKEEKEHLEYLKKYDDASIKYREDQATKQLKANMAAMESIKNLEFEIKLLGVGNEERERAVFLRDLENKGIVEGTEAYKKLLAVYEKLANATKKQQQDKKELENIEKQKKAYEDLWQSVDKEAENIFIDIAQNGEDAFKRIGQSIERYLLKMLYEMTVKQWIIQVSGVPGAGGAGGNMLSSFGSSALGGINIGGASLGAIGSSVGTGFTTTMMGGSVSGASAAYSSAGMSGVSAGLNAGAAGAYAAGILGGMAANRKLSGGYQLDNKHAQTIQDMAVIAATAFFGPLGGIAAGVGSAIVNRAFGRGAVKTGQTGITGTFSTEGASVRQFEEWSQKGGWFRSSRSGVNYSAVSNELDQFLDGSLIQITQATRMYAQILGLNADAVNGVTQSVRINLQGLNAEQQQESIMKALGGFADLLASRFGLTSETMAHLANSLATTNQVFETLNQRLFDTSLAAGEAASQLLELFGGVENFVQATSAYYRNFYTETERTTKATQQLTEVLAAMGFALPATRGEFRALVEAQDLMTTAGRQNYAALINLSQVFDEITPKLDTLAGKLGALVAGLVAELTTDLDKQINASADAARTARESARAYAEAARALGAAAQDILGGTTSTAQSLTLLRRAFGTQLASARSGNLDAMQGLGSTATDLQQAERDMAVTSVDFARQNALIALRLKEAAALAESSAAAADYQAMLFDVNTSMLQVLKDSLMSGSASVELLQEQLSALQYMANILANVDDGTQEQISMTDLVARATGGNEMLSAAILNQLQVPDAGSEFLSRTIALGNEFIAGRLDGVISAINQQTADQQAEIKRQQDLQKAHSQLDLLRERQALAISQVNTASQAIYGLAGRHGVFLNAQQGAVQLSNTARFGVDDKGLFEAAYNQISFTGSAQKSTNFRNDFYASGGLYDQTYGRASELRNLSAELEAQREAIRALGGVPAFAAGGMHSGGLRLVGERGPELEVTGPSRIFNANQTSAMLGGGGEVATEIRALRQEVTMLRHEAQATAINTGRTQDLMKRVTRNGEAMTVQTDGNKLEVTEL